MKATEQYFPVALFIMLYKVVLTFESVDKILKCNHSNESYWAVLSRGLFIMLYKMVLAFKSVDEILKCDNSNERCCTVISIGTVYCVLQGKRLRLWMKSWSVKLQMKYFRQ